MDNMPRYEDLVNKVQVLEQEVAHLQHVEKNLEESREHFKLLYDRAPLAYQSLDELGNILEVNPSWLNALGYTKKEVIGKSFADFLHPD
jgi:PAS domain-containing protein